MLVNQCVINEKVYKFQHPGNREWLKLQSKMLDIKTQSIDMEKLIDYCFEHVVHPAEGGKLKLDDLHPRELEAWQLVLPRFLRGELDSGYIYPEDKQAKKAGQKLLQKMEKDVSE